MKRVLVALLLFGLVTVGKSFAADEIEPGLVGEYFDIGEQIENVQGVADKVKDKKPKVKKVDKTVNFDSTDEGFNGTDLVDQFFIRWTGVIKIEKDGKYKFFTNSDDGSKLSIDGKVVVDNDGDHGMEEKEGEVELKAGNHDIKIEFYENGGGAGCIASWEPAGGAKEVISEKVLFHKKGTEAK
ncbi:MAG: PA14 domain-containing protein [Planctomycetota bacterium]|nr:PA14 domain-containing protein [Planctomycetota bacterium]